jgi:hypothetical protein
MTPRCTETPSGHLRPLLRPEDVEARLGLIPDDLARYRLSSVTVRFDPEDVDAWEKLNRPKPSVVPSDYKPKGLVYFVQAGEGHVKIGFTRRSLKKRLSDLDIGSPVPIKVIGVLEFCGLAEERNLQEALVHYRVKGEWFEADAVYALLDAGDFLPRDGVAYLRDVSSRKGRDVGGRFIRKDAA